MVRINTILDKQYKYTNNELFVCDNLLLYNLLVKNFLKVFCETFKLREPLYNFNYYLIIVILLIPKGNDLRHSKNVKD